MPESEKPKVFNFGDLKWVDERAERNADPELIEAGKRLGARRKRLAQGEGGFYLQYTEMPAGFEVPLHSHDYAELFMVLSGSCRIWPDGPEESVELGPRDSVALAAGHPYRFICGPKGLEFYVVRQGEASATMMR